MKTFDVAIIGGGISGLSAAITLSSAIADNPSVADISLCVIDAQKSDALRAKFFNAPGIKQGTSGKKAIAKLRDQLASYKLAVTFKSRVRRLEKTTNSFQISTNDYEPITASNIIIATGFRKWNIDGLGLPIVPFTRTNKPSRVAIAHQQYRVADNIYVCGLLADVSSQYPIVAGTGAQVAINLLYDLTGEWIVVHDK